MKSRILFILILLCLVACKRSYDVKTPDDEHGNTEIIIDTSQMADFEKTIVEQDASSDAMNTIQRNTAGHFYCTFVQSIHNCESPDTTFVLNQPQLQMAIEHMMFLYCVSLSPEKQFKLAEEAVLAQERYSVEQCYGPNREHMSGTWHVRNILNRKDMIMEW